MTVETPDHFMGEPIPKDAIEIALAAEKKKKDGNEDRAQGEAPSLDGFIYVPSIKLHFAKERSHLGEDWYDAHRELHKQNLSMPTIPQFIEFLKYLRADPTAENKSIYDEIIEKRDPRRKVWLDAKFHKKGNQLWVAYNHIVNLKGDLEAQENERLEGHLMRDRDPGINKKPGISLEHWLNNPTKQGLPQENSEQGDLRYWHPKENRVVRFYTCPNRAYLNCSAELDFADSLHSVFACAKNAGGNQ